MKGKKDVNEAAGESSNTGNTSAFARVFPLMAVVLAAVYIAAAFLPAQSGSPYAFQQFGLAPVLHEGRVKPADTAARSSLMLLSNRQTLRVDGRSMQAIEWMLDVAGRPETAEGYPVFRVDHPDIQALLGDRGERRNYYSFREIIAHGQALMEQFSRASRAFDTDKASITPYQKKLLELNTKLRRYQDLVEMDAFVPVFTAANLPAPGPPGRSLEERMPESPEMASFIPILAAYQNDKPGDFNAAVAAHLAKVREQDPALAARMGFESLFRHVEPFYLAMVLYVVIFLLAVASWLGWSAPLGKAALALTLVTLLLHTVGLAARVYLHGHPPVTNLYASAIFVGWACVILAIALEIIHRNGIGSAMAGVVGFLTLLIAHNLSDGDNLEAVRAVLDTNLWLSTHVVVVTIGYASTFLAGFLGILYVVRGVFTRSLGGETARSLARMTYGIICFAALASFVGTILGGIWADQSWGRFWGWDPKENGALLIVLANALILHARWAGLVRERGMAVLAIAGNIVTSWSWFGVNMLNVGLHSYGFMDKAVGWLGAFVASQLVLIAIGSIPLRYWRSFRRPAAEPAKPVAARRSRPQPA